MATQQEEVTSALAELLINHIANSVKMGKLFKDILWGAVDGAEFYPTLARKIMADERFHSPDNPLSGLTEQALAGFYFISACSVCVFQGAW